jgi:hypothetical protein
VTNVAEATSAREPDVFVDETPEAGGVDRWSTPRRVVQVAAALIALQLVRGCVYLWLVGGGEELRLRTATPGVGLCVDSGFVGFVRLAD